jgi:hypothetical protein
LRILLEAGVREGLVAVFRDHLEASLWEKDLIAEEK